MKDIAQAVGVSTALVSYVLNNKKENRIGKEVAQKIRQTAQELNYQPNQIAKSLKSNKTQTLGLVIADIANPFSAIMARMIEDEADRQQYTVIVGSSDENPQKFQKLITTFLARQVDGLLIAAPQGTENQLRMLQKQQIPFVLLDRYFPALPTSYVALNNYQATYMAVQELVRSGYQRIGLITLKSALLNIQERTKGYLSALADYQLPTEKQWVQEINRNGLDIDVANAIQKLTTGPQAVEAIILTTNTLTLSALKRIKALRKKLPQDLALIGFDETEAYALFETSITYIQQPIQEMGQLATRLLLDTLNGQQALTQAHLNATLVVQASSQPRY